MADIAKNEAWYGELQGAIEAGQPVTEFISGAIGVLNQMEAAAQNPHLPETKEEAEKIKALWVISAPGTYFQARKNDRYKDKPWALWNDRQRINYAFKIGRKMEALTQMLPLIVYSGRPDEAAAISEAVRTPWLRIPQGLEYPRDKVFLINPSLIDNAIDQIKTFRLPPALEIGPGDEIGLVIHAPQAVRFLYALACFKDIVPKGVSIRAFLLPTPKGGFPEYPLQELRGTVANRFIASPAFAPEQPYPVKI